MNQTTRQKYLDAMSRRADLLQQADNAFSEGRVEDGIALTEQARGLNQEIQGYQALQEQERQFADHSPAPMAPEAADRAAERAETLRNGGRITFTAQEVQDALGIRVTNSTTLATGTLVEPTRVGTTIRDGLGPVSSILDQVTAVDLTGCQAILEPLLYAEPEAQTGKVDTLAGTARTASDPTFGAAKIAPFEASITSFVDRNLSRLTPVAYEQKIREVAMRALRRKVAAMVYNGDGQPSNSDMFGIKTAQDIKGTTLLKKVNVTAVAAGVLEDLVFSYGSDEEIGGNARLFLNKLDLAAIGKLRGADDKALYKVIPDPANANTGRITDGGLVVPYTIGSALTPLSTAEQGSADVLTMLYGDPANYTLGLFGPYSIRVDESVKAVERMSAILGDVFVGGNLTVKDGFIAATVSHA